MRFTSLAVIAMSFGVSVSQAADMPTEVLPVAQFGSPENLRLKPAGWTGFNAVLFAGGGFLQGSDSLGLDAFFRSALFGGSLGYDHQFNNIVFGAGVEGALTNFRGNSSSGNFRQKSNWLSSATVRIGYDAGRFMPYLSGGIGFGNYEIERKSDGASDENTQVGYVLGGGLEARITEGLFARADYKHYEFSDQRYTVPGTQSFTAEGNADIFQLGVGYRF